jgi:DNA-binding CsgD family transcriptional regulator
LEVREIRLANHYLAEGIAFTAEHDDDYHRLEIEAWLALARLYQGRWREAKETALKVLKIPNIFLVTQTGALCALGRLLVRQGDTSAHAMLDEALAVSIQANSPRFDSPRLVRAEAAWLAGDDERALAETDTAYEIAVRKEHPWVAGELAFWRWRSGETKPPPVWIAKPFALQIAGDWQSAAAMWEKFGCPYERAMALMDGDQSARLAALEIFERLGARPAAEIVRQKLQAVPSRRLEKEKFGGLTEREREVAALIAQGKSNREIAEAMVVGVRTVETYVTRILNKLDFDSRVQVATWAVEKGLIASTRDLPGL